MALIRGVGSKFPCPICMVPEDEMSDLEKYFDLRTTEQTEAIIKEARALTRAAARERLLQSNGLRDVDVRCISHPV